MKKYLLGVVSVFLLLIAGCKASVVTPENELTATLAVNTSIVGVATGANIITATFNTEVDDLSTTNANGEFTFTGCTTSPSVAIVTATVSGISTATATLSGGTCADGATVDVELHLENVLDAQENLGLVENNPSANYTINTGTATSTLAAAQYPSSQSAIKNGDTSTLDLTFANAFSQTLTASSGTTSAAPAGLTVSTTGTASCTTVQISSPTTSGATISVSGCAGDGTVLVKVNAGVATNYAAATSAASTQQTILVENTPPTVTLSGAAATGGADGSNSITANFSSLINSLSSTNANGEVVVVAAGCSTLPTVAISMSTVSGHSRAMLNLSLGVCGTAQNISVQFHLENTSDLAGNAGQASGNPSPVQYVTP